MRYLRLGMLVVCLFTFLLYGAEETSNDIIAQWHFDEGTGKTVNDNSGNSNNGEFIGNPQWGKGVSGSAVALDGNTKLRILSGCPGIDKAATFEAWIKPENVTGRIIMKNIFRDGRDVNFLLGCTGPRYGLATRGLIFGVANTEKNRASIDSEVDILDGKWHYVAVTCDGNLIKMYVDGRLDLSAVEQYSGPLDPGTAPLFIGGYSSAPSFFKGMIDEVTIWKRALTGEEIKERFEKLEANR